MAILVLDTNVISELMRAAPAPAVLDWFARQRPERIHTTTVTEAELRFGLAILPEGGRRAALLAALDAVFTRDLAGRILGFDRAAAAHYARIAAARRSGGQPIAAFDAQIAAIACAASGAVVTRNVRDFADCGVELENPWGGTAP